MERGIHSCLLKYNEVPTPKSTAHREIIRFHHWTCLAHIKSPLNNPGHCEIRLFSQLAHDCLRATASRDHPESQEESYCNTFIYKKIKIQTLRYILYWTLTDFTHKGNKNTKLTIYKLKPNYNSHVNKRNPGPIKQVRKYKQH